MNERPVVAVVGTRFTDFAVEEGVLGDVTLVAGPGTDADELVEMAGGARVILVGAAPRLDRSVLERLSCRGIVRLGVGVDNVDLEAAAEQGMWVASVPDYGTEAVALHTVTLVLAAIRRLPMAERDLRSGSWGFGGHRPLHLPWALTVGVVGYGRIGRRVAEMLAGVGFNRFLVSDPVLTDPPASHEPVSLGDLLRRADIVTLHAPAPESGALLADAELASMRPGSVLVNTARGSLVDSEALVAALGRGRPAIAALDVFISEPPDLGVFADVLDRVILTPHMSWYTEETETDLRRQGAMEARRILDGEPPLHPVAVPR